MKQQTWHGVLAIEGVEAEGRVIMPGALQWEAEGETGALLMPLALMHRPDPADPESAVPCGCIDNLVRQGSEVRGVGRYWGPELPAGTRRSAAIQVLIGDSVLRARDSSHELEVLEGAALLGATVLGEDQPPLWPQCTIIFYPAVEQ